MILQFHLWAFLQTEQKHSFEKIYAPHVYCSIIYKSQPILSTSINGWMNPNIQACVHTCTQELGYYSTIKTNEILAFAMTRMEAEGIMLREISQTKKDKYYLYNLVYMWNWKHTCIYVFIYINWTFFYLIFQHWFIIRHRLQKIISYLYCKLKRMRIIDWICSNLFWGWQEK